jgi:TPR repeat protein
MRPLAPMPQLTLPYALVGAAAGALCCGVLANPLLREHPAGDPLVAAVVTALIGALVGAFLHRRCSARASMWASPGSTRAPLMVALLAGGATSGAVVGAIAWQTERGAIGGASAGLVAAVAFFPVAAAVMGAALRAERARMGSWVAASDRRAVWAILGTALAMATVLGLPDWPAARHSRQVQPEVSLLIAAAGAVAALVALAGDALAGDLLLLRRFRALGSRRARFAELEDADHGNGDLAGVEALDLGMGQGTLAELERCGSAYRGRDRAVALLIGDVDTARRAVVRSAAVAAAGVVLCVAMLAVHRWAAGPAAVALYREQRCEQREARACGLAADHHLRGEAPRSSPERAAELLFRGCALGDIESCRRHGGLLGDALPTENSHAAVDASLRAGCQAGDDASCRRRIDRALAPGRWDRESVHALVPLYNAACDLGDARACIELRVLVTLVDEDDPPLHEVLRCLHGFAVACDVAADQLRPVERPAGLALRELACAHGLTWSCHVAGWKWLEADRRHGVGFSGLDAEARAVTLYTRACELGAAFSCCEAAYIRAHSEVGNRDIGWARELLRLAAAKGHAEIGACSILRSEPEMASR